MTDRLVQSIKQLTDDQRKFMSRYIDTRLANLRQSSSDEVLEVFAALREMVDQGGTREPETNLHSLDGSDLAEDPRSRRRKRTNDGAAMRSPRSE